MRITHDTERNPLLAEFHVPTNANIQDIDFVLHEVLRFSKLTFDQLKQKPPDDLLAVLPHPEGRGSLICGQTAARRLFQMAEREVARSAQAGRVNPRVVFDNLRTDISRRFLKDKQPINQRQADRSASSAIRLAARRVADLTHIIPCHLVADRKPDTLRIGPVTFSRRENRWPTILELLQASRPPSSGVAEAAKKRNWVSADDRTLRDATRYYETFEWIAEVLIENCDPEMSEQRARRMAGSALDCLQLLLGSHHSDRMQIGGFGISSDRRVRIALKAGGEASITTTIGGLTNILGEDWWDYLKVQAAPILELMGIAINEGYRLPRPTPVATRFLDAASWVGEAIRDRNPAASLVKCVLAIERTVIARHHEGDLAETVATRGAMLARRGEQSF